MASALGEAGWRGTLNWYRGLNSYLYYFGFSFKGFLKGVTNTMFGGFLIITVTVIWAPKPYSNYYGPIITGFMGFRVPGI